jgi:hypothetical protein
MGMNIDPARSENVASRLDFLFAFARDFSDLDDSAGIDGNIALESILSRTVDNRGVSNHEIVHAGPPCWEPNIAKY